MFVVICVVFVFNIFGMFFMLFFCGLILFVGGYGGVLFDVML